MANVMTGETPTDTTTSTTEAPNQVLYTTTTLQPNLIHPGRMNVSTVNKDLVFILTPEEITYSKLLEEITLSKKLKNETSIRTCRHLQAFNSFRHPVPPPCRCPGGSHLGGRSRLGHPWTIPPWVRRFPGLRKFFECMIVNRRRRDSLNEDESNDNKEVTIAPETDLMMRLPRSGRGYHGFGGFGGARGGWRNWNWGNNGGRNNGNTGGLWSRGLPGVGFSLFGNRAGSSMPPRSDSLPDLSTGGLSAQLLNLWRSPSATDLVRTAPGNEIPSIQYKYSC